MRLLQYKLLKYEGKALETEKACWLFCCRPAEMASSQSKQSKRSLEALLH